MSEAASSSISQHQGHGAVNDVFALTLQSLAFGVHLLLLPFGMHMIMKRGHKAKAKAYLLLAILVPFFLSSVYWALRLADLVVGLSSLASSNKSSLKVGDYKLLFGSIILLNSLIADAIVVWRAWVLCREDSRRLLLAPALCLILTALSIISAIGLRTSIIITNFQHDVHQVRTLSKWLNFFQFTSTVFSLLTNTTATSVVGLKIWRFRKFIKAGLRFAPNRSTRVEQILVLLIEAGLLYCVGTALTLTFILIRLPSSTLGDICAPMSFTVAGVYPTIVIVLVNLQQSANRTMEWQTMDLKTAGPSATAFTSRIASVQVDRIRSIASEQSSVAGDQLTAEGSGTIYPLNE